MNTTPQDVVDSFNEFLKRYDQFRKQNGLSSHISNVHEILTGMTDKHGRICRQVKHTERNDPKSDWPVAMTESIYGYIV